MKQNIIIALVLIGFTAGCGGSDLDARKQELEQARAEVKALNEKIATLESEIAAEEGDTAPGEVNAVLVNYQVVQPADFSHTIDVRGNIASRTNVYLSSESAGRITQVAVVEGPALQ